jgi:hypothetical protein
MSTITDLQDNIKCLERTLALANKALELEQRDNSQLKRNIQDEQNILVGREDLVDAYFALNKASNSGNGALLKIREYVDCLEMQDYDTADKICKRDLNKREAQRSKVFNMKERLKELQEK